MRGNGHLSHFLQCLHFSSGLGNYGQSGQSIYIHDIVVADHSYQWDLASYQIFYLCWRSFVTSLTGFIRNFEHIFQGLFQDISRTTYEFFQDFKNEMALKAPSNTAGGLEKL